MGIIFHQHRWTIYGLISLLLFIYAILTGIIPRVQNLLFTCDTIGRHEEIVKEVYNWRKDIDLVALEIEGLNNQVQELIYNQNDKTHLSTILKFIQQGAQGQHLRILTIQPQEVKKMTRHTELPIQIKMTANYHAIATFINRIETGSVLARIRTLKINADKINTTTLKIECVLVVLFLNQAV